MKYLLLVLLALPTSAGAQIYNYFSPGCALSGNATSQTVNLNTGGCIVGNLSVNNLNGGTSASATTYFSGAGTWTTPPGAPGGANQQVQVNNSGTFAGYPNFTWNSSLNTLYLGYSTSSANGSLVIGGSGSGIGTVRAGAELDLSGNPLILYTTGGGALNVAGSAGTGAGTGTSISMTAGNTGLTSTSPGGAVTITGGVGNASAVGGQIALVGGSGYSTTGTGGNVTIQGGLGNTVSKSGQVNVLTNNTTRLTIPNTGGLFINPPTVGSALVVSGLAGSIFASQAVTIISPNTASQSNGMRIFAGTNSADSQLVLTNAANTTNDWIFLGDGGLISPGQSSRGLGTINAAGLYVNGVAVSTGGGGVTSIAGTANQIAASASTGAVTLSMPHNVIIPAPISGASLTVNGVAGTIFTSQALSVSSPNTSGQSNGMRIIAGTNSGDSQLVLTNAADTLNYWEFWGNGALTSNGQNNNGAGTINAQGLYVNGVQVPKTVYGTCQASGTLNTTTQNYGVASCVLLSTGIYRVNLSIAFTTLPPTCTAGFSGGPFYGQVVATSTSTVSVSIFSGATQSNSAFSIICVGL